MFISHNRCARLAWVACFAEILRLKTYEPVLLLGQDKFAAVDIRIRVKGGGFTAQIYAIRQAIAKALVAYYQKVTNTTDKRSSEAQGLRLEQGADLATRLFWTQKESCDGGGAPSLGSGAALVVSFAHPFGRAGHHGLAALHVP
jgi:hypothetical protein